jgi:hypothetical protein
VSTTVSLATTRPSRTTLIFAVPVTGMAAATATFAVARWPTVTWNGTDTVVVERALTTWTLTVSSDAAWAASPA